MDPRRRNEDRDAAYIFYGMHPLLFDRTRRTVLLAGWLYDMETIFRICYIEPHFQFLLASWCLVADTRIWWITVGEPTLQGGSWVESVP